MRPYRRFFVNYATDRIGSLDGAPKRNLTGNSSDQVINRIIDGGISKEKKTGLGRNKKFQKEVVAKETDAASTSGGKKKLKKDLPNYFVAVPVKNSLIKEKLQEVQKSILESNKKLKSAMVSLDKSHITLMVMHLKDQEHIDCATKALEMVIARMKSEGITDMSLNFEGLGHFRNEVLFAKICQDGGLEKLRQIAAMVRQIFTDHGISTTDNRAFQAHMTVAKLSKDPKLRFRGVRKIDGNYYQDYESMVFGQEICSKLQLLCMQKTDKVTGYYHCMSELQFGNNVIEVMEKTKAGTEVA